MSNLSTLSQTNLLPHYSQYTGEWPYPNFTIASVACKHCGELYIDHSSMQSLQALRDAWSSPLIINSAHRCIVHNAKVGGKEHSMHLKLAFDIRMPKHKQAEFKKLAEQAGFMGVGTYNTFIHVDKRPNRARW